MFPFLLLKQLLPSVNLNTDNKKKLSSMNHFIKLAKKKTTKLI